MLFVVRTMMSPFGTVKYWSVARVGWVSRRLDLWSLFLLPRKLDLFR